MYEYFKGISTYKFRVSVSFFFLPVRENVGDKDAVIQQLAQLLSMEGDLINTKVERLSDRSRPQSKYTLYSVYLDTCDMCFHRSSLIPSCAPPSLVSLMDRLPNSWTPAAALRFLWPRCCPLHAVQRYNAWLSLWRCHAV